MTAPKHNDKIINLCSMCDYFRKTVPCIAGAQDQKAYAQSGKCYMAGYNDIPITMTRDTLIFSTGNTVREVVKDNPIGLKSAVKQYRKLV